MTPSAFYKFGPNEPAKDCKKILNLLRNSLNLTAVLVMTEIAVPIWQLNFLSNSLYEFESKSKSELKQSRFT